jgi:hypothetical protein
LWERVADAPKRTVAIAAMAVGDRYGDGARTRA